jgi:hypothetical protein
VDASMIEMTPSAKQLRASNQLSGERNNSRLSA